MYYSHVIVLDLVVTWWPYNRAVYRDLIHHGPLTSVNTKIATVLSTATSALLTEAGRHNQWIKPSGQYLPINQKELKSGSKDGTY